jgi:hypothetical protein
MTDPSAAKYSPSATTSGPLVKIANSSAGVVAPLGGTDWIAVRCPDDAGGASEYPLIEVGMDWEEEAVIERVCF